MTLQGEFEDETMNDAYTPRGKSSRRTQSVGGVFGNMEDNNEGEDEDDDDEEEEEVTVEEVIALEGLDNEDSYDDDEDDEEFLDDDEEEGDEDGDGGDDGDDAGSFWNSSPAGKNNQLKDIPDFSVYRPEKPDVSDIPADAFVTDEDTKSLRRAHRKADKIIQYAADIKLIASFHYKKKNYHLVKLLEVCMYVFSYSGNNCYVIEFESNVKCLSIWQPMFLVGKRIMDIKGYYFTLLDDDESAKVSSSPAHILCS